LPAPSQRFGHNPRKRVLLLHGGPGGLWDDTESFVSGLVPFLDDVDRGT
jgi:hypothetical protein